MADLRFYFDENVPVAVAVQLKKRGIEAYTVRDLNRLGESDIDHLAHATSMNAVLCTNDSDFLDLAYGGITHSGIVFGQQHRHGVGDWVKFLELAAAIYTVEEMRNRVEYL